MRLLMRHTVHLVLTGVMFAIAYIFLGNDDNFTHLVSFSWMTAHMTDHHWGWFFGGVAFFGAATMLSNSWRWRTSAACVLSAAHGGFAIALFLGNSYAIGSILCLGYAALGLILAYTTAQSGRRGATHLEVFNPKG